ncbi:MAG: polyprenyl synthetase family protein [Candidatus Hecatellaceae archaeon]
MEETLTLDEVLSRYVSEARVSLEKAFKALLSELKSLTLHPQAVYALTSGGKRLRPVLALLAGEAVGGSRQTLIPLAVSIELIHTATLIHDDIIDGDEQRRGKPALHVQWRDKALLAGDLLFVKAVNLASTFYSCDVLKAIAEASMEACDGEFLDVTMRLENSSEEEVIAKVKMKSASLFKAASWCGAIVGGGTPSEVEALKLYGENLGIAYQLADDLKEAEEGLHRDLKAGRLTLPYLHLYAHGDERLKGILKSVFGTGRLSSGDVKALDEGLKAYGSLSHCKGKIAGYVAKAVGSLSPLRENHYKQLLEVFAHRFTGVENPV